MCIIAYIPENQEITQDIFDNCWESNSNGGGFMYATGDALHIHKGFMTKKEIQDAYFSIGRSFPRVLHFRIATHGKTNSDNTHPFRINHALGFVHNGVILKTADTKSDHSDTWHFNEQILKPLANKNGRFYKDSILQSLIESFIGGSKLVFLHKDKSVKIFNESMGNWDNNIWFSNTSWKPRIIHAPVQTPWIHRQDEKYGNLRTSSIYDEDDYVETLIDINSPNGKTYSKGTIAQVCVIGHNNLVKIALQHDIGGRFFETYHWVKDTDIRPMYQTEHVEMYYGI